IMSIDRSIVTQAELLENDTRHEQAFDALFDFMRELCNRLAGDTLYELPRLVMKMSERGAGHDGVQVTCDRADVFRDRPLVVIQNNNESLCMRFDVVECFVANPACERGIAGDYHDVLVTASQVTPNGHAKRCGKRRPCMSRAITIVLALGAQKKAVEP